MTEQNSKGSRDDVFSKMIDLIETLRSENGCPWDKKQTPESFHPYILEEYHEMVQAISSGDHGEIADELGDLFFQVVELKSLVINLKLIRYMPNITRNIIL